MELAALIAPLALPELTTIVPVIFGNPAAITLQLSPPLKKERNEQKYENKNCLSIR